MVGGGGVGVKVGVFVAVGNGVNVAVAVAVVVGAGNFVESTPQAESAKPADAMPAALRKSRRVSLFFFILPSHGTVDASVKTILKRNAQYC